MKKGQVYNGQVVRVDYPNKGIVELEGKKAVVKNCIPGQKVSFAINRIRSERTEGKLVEVLERSALETRDRACSIFGACGGCSYHTLPYETQLVIKSDQVKRLLDGVCESYEYEGILGSPIEWEYRNKMEYTFGDAEKGGPLTLGFHKRDSFHDVLTAADCAIADKDFSRILSCVLDFSRENGFDYYHMYKHQGFLRHLVVRKAKRTGEILVDIVTTSQVPAVINAVEAFGDTVHPLRKSGFENTGETSEDDVTDYILMSLVKRLLTLKLEGTITGILHTRNDSLSDAVINEETKVLYGKDSITEELLGLRFRVSAFSFFQTNSYGAEVLYSKVREYAGDTRNKRIYDLYSGTGTIAQILAPVAGEVTGVEIVEEAVKAARENAALNGLDNCSFIAGDVLKVVEELDKKPDIIILDPPRDGIHPKALDKIIEFGVDRIIYVSCKPTSLVRDLHVLQERGYRVEKACAVDMFPQTVHVECVVLITNL